MQHRRKGKILSRNKEARELMLRNLATSLIFYEQIKTTKAKAKAVQPLIERIISLSRNSGLTRRRQLNKVLYSDKAVKKCLEVIGPKYKEKKGGCTRIVNIGTRKGDRATMVKIELV